MVGVSSRSTCITCDHATLTVTVTLRRKSRLAYIKLIKRLLSVTIKHGVCLCNFHVGQSKLILLVTADAIEGLTKL